jgi:hypothetical protein
MPRFVDFYQDLKLPTEAIAQIAKDTRNGAADEFGVRQVELYHNADGQVYCLLDGPDEDAIREHHARSASPAGTSTGWTG